MALSRYSKHSDPAGPISYRDDRDDRGGGVNDGIVSGGIVVRGRSADGDDGSGNGGIVMVAVVERLVVVVRDRSK